MIAGRTARGTQGPVGEVSTNPLYLDVSLAQGVGFKESLPGTHNAFVYVIEGQVSVQAEDGANKGYAGELAALTETGGLRLVAKGADARGSCWRCEPWRAKRRRVVPSSPSAECVPVDRCGSSGRREHTKASRPGVKSLWNDVPTRCWVGTRDAGRLGPPEAMIAA